MKIRSLIKLMGWAITVIVPVFAVTLVIFINSYGAINKTKSQREELVALADELRNTSREMTFSVREYVISGEEHYAERFIETMEIKNGVKPRSMSNRVAPGEVVSLKALINGAEFTRDEKSLLLNSLALSDDLAMTEEAALSIVQGSLPDFMGESGVIPNRTLAISLVFGTEYSRSVEAVMAPFDKFYDILDARIGETIDSASSNYNNATTAMFVLLVLIIIIIVFMLLAVNNWLALPVLKCIDFARKVASGQLDARLDYKSSSEIGSLAESLRSMFVSLMERIEFEARGKRFDAVLASSDTGIIICSQDGIITDWSSGAEKILGFAKSTAMGKPLRSIASEGEREKIDVLFARIAAGERPSAKEYDMEHSGSYAVPCSASFTPIYDNDEVTSTVMVFHDITKRRAAREKAKRFAAIIETADSGVVIRDRNGLITDWNKGAEDIMGYTAEEMIGQRADLYIPEEAREIENNFQERIRNGENINFSETLRIKKNGEIIHCSFSGSSIKNDKGEYDGHVVIFHDITEKRLAERHASRLAAIFANADAGIIVKDRDDRVVEWNVGASNILGYNREEMINEVTRVYTPQEEKGKMARIKNRLSLGEHVKNMDIVRIHKDGRLVDCSVSYTPILDAKGRFDGYVGVFLDISEKKRMEAELESALNTAKEATKAKSAFLANMSHEIRTPMNGIMGLAELALESRSLTGGTRNYLAKISSSAGELIQIINDILDISKIEANMMSLENIPFDMHNVFKACESISGQKAREKNLDLLFYSEPVIGKRLIGDPTRLRQVLTNLLSNAVKFTESGSVKLNSVLKKTDDGKALMYFEVKDTGIGMTERQLDRIFQPFVQADGSTTRKYGGTGLGLSITKDLVELMGGELHVESSPGVGSKFFFEIAFDTTEDESRDRNDVDGGLERRPVFKAAALVCEDNSTNQEVIKTYLTRMGFETIMASNGEIGVGIIKDRLKEGNMPDLIFMDIHMPVMDGLEATRAMLDMGCKTPIIALTANAMVSEKEQYLRQGMSDYLSKPFRAKDLWACVMKYLKPVGYADSGALEPAPLDLLENDIINWKKGVDNVGDIDLYKRIKQDFKKNNENSVKQILQAIESGDIKKAHRIAHTLKSSAKLLGADKLAQAALEAELSLSNGENTMTDDLVQQLTQALDDVLEILSEILSETLYNETEIKETEIPETAGVLDKVKVGALIGRMESLLKSGSVECMDYIEELKETLSPLGDGCITLIEQIENYDFDKALITLRELSHYS